MDLTCGTLSIDDVRWELDGRWLDGAFYDFHVFYHWASCGFTERDDSEVWALCKLGQARSMSHVVICTQEFSLSSCLCDTISIQRLVLSSQVPFPGYHFPPPSPSSSPFDILNKPFFFLSVAQRSHHAFIFSLLFALPTFTVGMIRSILSPQQNIVSSRKLLCSLYGTP